VSVAATFPQIRARHESLTREALRSVFKDQEADVVVAGRSLGDGWDALLARKIYTRNRNTAADIAAQVARKLRGEFDPDVMDAWLDRNAEIAAASINQSTRDSLGINDDPSAVFAALLTAGAVRYAATMVTSAANFGAKEGALAAGGKTKTWISSGKPDSRHASMDGQTVPLSENFSNGLAWPGDPDGGAEDNANCGCSIGFD
jgi:hypothetical protein